MQHQYKSEEENQNSKKKQKNTPGERNLKMHVENMNEDQQQQAIETINEDPNNITIVDNKGNDGIYNIKREIVEPKNIEVQVQRSTRIKSANPIFRLGNPIT